MKKQFVITLVSGACLGSLGTYFAMHESRDIARRGVHGVDRSEALEGGESEDATDPFAAAVNTEVPDADGHPHGYARMDMDDPFERDACISFWYMDMSTLVDNLELHTGHKFEKQVGKIYAGPLEILEEQAAFMKSYLAETKRIAAAHQADPIEPEK